MTDRTYGMQGIAPLGISNVCSIESNSMWGGKLGEDLVESEEMTETWGREKCHRYAIRRTGQAARWEEP